MTFTFIEYLEFFDICHCDCLYFIYTLYINVILLQMKFIKKYTQFNESIQLDMSKQNLSDLLESLTVWQDNLLNSIKAEELNIIDVLGDIRTNDLEELSEDPKFIERLSQVKLKKSELQSTIDYETFIKKKITFLPIYDIDANELMNPNFLFIQSFNESLNKLDPIRLYRVNDDIKKFYDKLSSKTIEIIDKNINYIYKTGNSGNNWELQNIKDENDTYKRFLTHQDLHDITGISDVNIQII